MPRPISDSLYILPTTGPGRSGWRRVRLGVDGPDLNERWLQNRIADDPELVLGPCRTFEFIDEDEPWVLWATEMPVTDIGSVDVVLVSSEGRIALVEVKLARNPDIRRKVVAQLLDYAIHLREATLADLKKLPTEGVGARVDPEDVQQSLREGNFLLIIAADAADDRAAKLTRAVLDRNAIHPWDLALVDLALFASVDETKPSTELLCVPHLIGGVLCESRHVVEVKVANSAEHASVVVKLAEPEQTRAEGTAWTRDSFRQALPTKVRNMSFCELALAWLAESDSDSNIAIQYGKGKYPTANFTHKNNPFASVEKNGIWIHGAKQLQLTFGSQLGVKRWSEVRVLFPEQEENKLYFLVRQDDPRLARAVTMLRSWSHTSD